MTKFRKDALNLLFLILISTAILEKYTSKNIYPGLSAILIILIFILWVAPSAIFTIIFLIKRLRSKKISLILTSSIFTTIIYTFTDVFASNLIFESLGYRPSHVPHTAFVVFGVSLICLSCQIFVIIGFMLSIFYPFYDMLLKPILIIMHKNNLKEFEHNIFHLGLGSLSLSLVFLTLFLFFPQFDLRKITQDIAVEMDYLPIYDSGYICKRARQYEKFNYLSKNLISVYKKDDLTKKPVFSILECTTA